MWGFRQTPAMEQPVVPDEVEATENRFAQFDEALRGIEALPDSPHKEAMRRANEAGRLHEAFYGTIALVRANKAAPPEYSKCIREAQPSFAELCTYTEELVNTWAEFARNGRTAQANILTQVFRGLGRYDEATTEHKRQLTWKLSEKAHEKNNLSHEHHAAHRTSSLEVVRLTNHLLTADRKLSSGEIETTRERIKELAAHSNENNRLYDTYRVTSETFAHAAIAFRNALPKPDEAAAAFIPRQAQPPQEEQVEVIIDDTPSSDDNPNQVGRLRVVATATTAVAAVAVGGPTTAIASEVVGGASIASAAPAPASYSTPDNSKSLTLPTVTRDYRVGLANPADFQIPDGVSRFSGKIVLTPAVMPEAPAPATAQPAVQSETTTEPPAAPQPKASTAASSEKTAAPVEVPTQAINYVTDATPAPTQTADGAVNAQPTALQNGVPTERISVSFQTADDKAKSYEQAASQAGNTRVSNDKLYQQIVSLFDMYQQNLPSMGTIQMNQFMTAVALGRSIALYPQTAPRISELSTKVGNPEFIRLYQKVLLGQIDSDNSLLYDSSGNPVYSKDGHELFAITVAMAIAAANAYTPQHQIDFVKQYTPETNSDAVVPNSYKATIAPTPQTVNPAGTPNKASQAPEQPAMPEQLSAPAFQAHLGQLIETSKGNGTPTWPGSAAALAKIFSDAADKYNNPLITKEFLAAQAYAESNFYPRAKSKAGALGISQFMPKTWQGYGEAIDHDGPANIFNPKDAIFAQAHYMSDIAADMRRSYPNLSDYDILRVTLASYNAGEHAVAINNGLNILNNYAETGGYVVRIVSLLENNFGMPLPSQSSPEQSAPSAMAQKIAEAAKADMQNWPKGSERLGDANPYVTLHYTNGRVEAWCSDWDNTIDNRAGVGMPVFPGVKDYWIWATNHPNIFKTYTRQQMLDNGLRYQPGDSIFINWDQGDVNHLLTDSNSNHTGIVVGIQSNGDPIFISGNYGDKVTQDVIHDHSVIVGIARPQ